MCVIILYIGIDERIPRRLRRWLLDVFNSRDNIFCFCFCFVFECRFTRRCPYRPLGGVHAGEDVQRTREKYKNNTLREEYRRTGVCVCIYIYILQVPVERVLRVRFIVFAFDKISDCFRYYNNNNNICARQLDTRWYLI